MQWLSILFYKDLSVNSRLTMEKKKVEIRISAHSSRPLNRQMCEKLSDFEL